MGEPAVFREALETMLATFGRPHRAEWLNHAAYDDALRVYERARELLDKPKPRNGKKARLIDPKADRGAFWKYCVQTAGAARERATAKGVPYSIDAHFIDRLLVDQAWHCAVSGVPLRTPAGERGLYRKDPFGPSLDRIIPRIGYVPSNVRIVSNIVNSAMNEWGLDSLRQLVAAMAKNRPSTEPS